MMTPLASALRSRGISPATAGLASALVLGPVLALAAPGAAAFFGTAVSLVVPRAWTLATASLFETNVLKALVHAALLLASSTVLEPLWTTPEWLRFLSIAGIASSTSALVSTSAAAAARRAYTSTPALSLLTTPRHGAAGLVAACLVGVAQASPDRTVTVAKVWTLRMKHVPGVYLGLVAAFDLIAGRGRLLATLPLAVGGAYAGWAYLRFIQAREGGQIGDASAEFRLASFFPAPVAPLVDALGGVCDRARAAVRARAASGSGASESTASSTATSKAGDDAAAQRRRERGARALEERLKAKASGVTDVEAVAAA